MHLHKLHVNKKRLVKAAWVGGDGGNGADGLLHERKRPDILFCFPDAVSRWRLHLESSSGRHIKECLMQGKLQTGSEVEGVCRCRSPPGSGSACSGWMLGSAGPLSHLPSSGGNSSASSHR